MSDDDAFGFENLDAFRMRTVKRTPAQLARQVFEAAKGRAAADAFDAAVCNGATPDEAKAAARKAAATFVLQ